MTKYIFLTETNSENPNTEYFAISENQIETLKVSETYGKYGQQFSNYEAGDYLIITNPEKLNQYFLETEIFDYDDKIVKVSEGVYDGDSHEFSLIVNELGLDAKLLDFEVEYTTCEGFNAWSGNNYQSIIVGVQNGEAEYKIVDDKALIKRLRTAITKRKFVSEGFGRKSYEFGQIEIEESFSSKAWEQYTLSFK